MFHQSNQAYDYVILGSCTRTHKANYLLGKYLGMQQAVFVTEASPPHYLITSTCLPFFEHSASTRIFRITAYRSITSGWALVSPNSFLLVPA